MINKIKEKLGEMPKSEKVVLILILLFFGIIHLYIRPVFCDDVKFRTQFINANYKIVNLLGKRYMQWSSRVVIEFVMYIMTVLPVIIWKILDILCIFVLYKILSKYVKNKILLGLCICSYPFMHLGSAGWIATTTNYLWPFTAGLLAFYMLDKYFFDKIILYYMLYISLVVYTVSNEIFALLYLASIIIYAIYNRERIQKLTHTHLYSIYIGGVTSVIFIMFELLCPGNAIRKKQEILDWMPQFLSLNIVDKMRICIVSTFQHFTSIPNVIFLLFGFVLACVVIKESKNKYKKVVAYIPIVISSISTAYYAITEIIGKHKLVYAEPDITIRMGSGEFCKQVVICLAAIIYLFCIIVCLYWSFAKTSKGERRSAVINILIYLGGLISRFVLIISPTMLASGTRMYFVFYISQIYLLNILYDRIKKYKLIRLLVIAMLIIGMIWNLLTVYLFQRPYN
ncbi:MAG: hypothetical protein OGM15_11530 [Lachnospiraceae bacterium]|nr:MAG: hypothetical protein OGM15_11530 [Lachnospiraceae bacterium]